MYDINDYYNAKSINEASALLTSHPDSRVIAGGSDMLIKIRGGKFSGSSLVSIRNISELYGITMKENGDIEIGACETFSHITKNPLIQRYLPVLGEAVDKVGGPQIRNIGTIGGNISNGAVSADSAATLFSYQASLRIANAESVRVIPIHEFYLGPGKTDLKQGEILTHIIISKENYDGFTGDYIKYAMREAMDIATLSCSILCKLDSEKKKIEDIRITFGVAAPVPYRCKETEMKLLGHDVNDEIYDIIENGIHSEINPRDSWRASKAFRIQIGGEIAKRALKSAIEKQRG